MLAVVLDTNSIHRDPWLTGDTAQNLLGLADAGECVIVYPQVVVDELRRQRREAAKDAHDRAAKNVEDMARAGIDVTQTAQNLSANHEQIGSDLDNAFAAVDAHQGVHTAPVPAVSALELLARDLDRRRPFMEIDHAQKKKSVGFRDALIWETVLELLTTHPSFTPVLFVTADKGFLAEDGKRLHPDLLKDVKALGVPQDRLRAVKNIAQAISEVEAQAAAQLLAAEPEPTPDVVESGDGDERVDEAVFELKGMRGAVARVELVNAATDALYDLVNRSVAEQLLPGGDYGFPDFVEFSVPPIEDGVIIEIDQTTEFSFAESPDYQDVLIGTAEAVITIEGSVHRSDWSVTEEGLVRNVGMINDYYFDGISEQEVRVVVNLDTEDGHASVSSIVLEDAPTAPPAGTVLELELPGEPEADSG